jgi:hypothetical protein
MDVKQKLNKPNRTLHDKHPQVSNKFLLKIELPQLNKKNNKSTEGKLHLVKFENSSKKPISLKKKAFNLDPIENYGKSRNPDSNTIVQISKSMNYVQKKTFLNSVFNNCQANEKITEKSIKDIENSSHNKNFSQIEAVINKISVNSFYEEMKYLIGFPSIEKDKFILNKDMSDEYYKKKFDKVTKISPNFALKMKNQLSPIKDSSFKIGKELYSDVNKLIIGAEIKKKELMKKLSLRKKVNYAI